MSLDFQQVYQKIKEIGASAQQRQKSLDERRNHARFLFNLHADNPSGLREKVISLTQEDANIRCALPLLESLNTHIPAPPLPGAATLIAADGSQINPDRHASAQYGLVNVGAIIMRLNSGEAPVLQTFSQLLFDDELYTSSGNPISEAMVALKRDLAERSKLFDLATDFGTEGVPVITFTDGPIELWGAAGGEDASAYEESLRDYIRLLRKLQKNGITTAGFVDKPSADLLIRTLELTEAGPEEMKKLREFHPLRGVTDRWLFGEPHNPTLRPGERSAVFAFQSRSQKFYTEGLTLHFFYINTGTVQHPWPVRVEIPAWVAQDTAKLDLLHAVLVDQCKIMGVKPYPYLLHRAHETAVVSHQEKLQVDQMLEIELRRAGQETDEPSYKQSAKDLPGRSSY